MVKDAIVVGAGIIGATVAKALATVKTDVLLIDSNEPLAGTKPSGGHLKPSWFGGMKKEAYEPAMELLDQVWGLKEEEFLVYPVMKPTTVYRVDTDVVVSHPKTVGTVTAIDMLDNYPRVVYSTRVNESLEERTRLLVVAAGVWCRPLLPQFFSDKPIVGKQGVSFRYRGKVTPFISPWAPYKQVVAHQQGVNEIWVGDGSTILSSNWTDARTTQCSVRCQTALGASSTNLVRTLMGIRPYCNVGSSDPCLLSNIGKRTWVATGAGKSGTIAAGWVARRILDAIL